MSDGGENARPTPKHTCTLHAIKARPVKLLMRDCYVSRTTYPVG